MTEFKRGQRVATRCGSAVVCLIEPTRELSIGVQFDHGGVLNWYRPNDLAPWPAILEDRADALRYRWLVSRDPVTITAIAWSVKAACAFATPNEAIDAAIGATV